MAGLVVPRMSLFSVVLSLPFLTTCKLLLNDKDRFLKTTDKVTSHYSKYTVCNVELGVR
jgi:hypothetical protein